VSATGKQIPSRFTEIALRGSSACLRSGVDGHLSPELLQQICCPFFSLSNAPFVRLRLVLELGKHGDIHHVPRNSGTSPV
jgi:hypothetical protein